MQNGTRHHAHSCVCQWCDPRTGDWMQTFLGKQFWPLDPRARDIHIVDVAHSLAMQCRYGGHSDWFYSVAEHSVRASYLVQPSLALLDIVLLTRRAAGTVGVATETERGDAERTVRLATLLHDAAETYLGDVIRPLKMHIGRVYHEAEERLERLIAERFDVPAFLFTCPPVKRADVIMLMTEKRDILKPAAGEWGFAQAALHVEPSEQVIATPCWSPEEGKRRFLERFHALGGIERAA